MLAEVVHFKELSEILTDGGSLDVGDKARTAKATDAWPVAIKAACTGKTDHIPDAVVRVRSETEVAAVLKWATKTGTPVTPWGLGSSVIGAPLAERGGISLDISGLNQSLDIDEVNLTVTVDAGIMGGALEDELNKLGHTMNHSPQSLHRSTVGGWLATRATGQFSSRYGGIEDICLSFTVILSDGSKIEMRQTPRMAVGPDLRHLFLGSEGCFGVITKVVMKIFPQAEARVFETITFPDVPSGVEACRAIMAKGLQPFLLRFYDLDEARHATKDHEFTSPVMFLGCDGVATCAEAEINACQDVCVQNGGAVIGPTHTLAWMERRFDFSSVENLLAQPTGLAETIEVSHDWRGIGNTYNVMKAALAPHADEVLGHFSHSYTTGISLYMILLGHADSHADGERKLREIWKVAMEAALETGASISHHHGCGMARSAYIRRDLGDGVVGLLQQVKDILDPAGIMNPGKLGLATKDPSEQTTTTG